MADVMINLSCARQTFTQALYFFGQKVRLSSLPSSKTCRRLNTLGQKQYLVGEVGENCLIQV